ncbi:unnamed protein product [Amoebophrya sp. A25]|nr:unnamed protein product [Amoebophrya sp. A25]|eukprot:GSA25T00007096001.1
MWSPGVLLTRAGWEARVTRAVSTSSASSSQCRIRRNYRAFSSSTTSSPPDVALFRSGKNDIFFNFSAEGSLCNQPFRNVLFQWRNETVVTIGRHQNPWSECKLSELEKDGVELVRRASGGGAVLQDLGCPTFTFLGNASDYGGIAGLSKFCDRNFNLVLKALERSGVSGCSRSGRNDIVWSGPGEEGEKVNYKISGSAFKTLKNRANEEKMIHHGTLLYNTDFGALGRYLTPSKVKLQAKGIQSVKSRVRNLKDLNPDLSLEELLLNMETVFLEEVNPSAASPPTHEVLLPDTPMLVKDPVFQATYEKISDWNFRFGETPDFSHTMGPVRLPKSQDPDGPVWGQFECHLEVTGGRVKRGVVFSDCLLPEAVTQMNVALRDCDFEYSAEAFALLMKESTKKMTTDEQRIAIDFATWAGKEMKA